MDKKVRVRFAPASTGFLHIGTARTALFNWLFARHYGGKFILRIEDTDLKRSSQEMADIIIDSLQWLGLDWDEGPVYQSQRMELYRESVQKLLDSGRAYYCYCSQELLAHKREEAKRNQRDMKYDRTCLTLTPAERNKLGAMPRSVRLFIPEGETAFEDAIGGRITRKNEDIEDLVILRSDGRPTYNVACVVDDAQMGITHVIRGNDHISNTFKQIILYRALDLTPPVFAHLPLSLGQDRTKLSKRHGATSVTTYREEGYLPEAVVNFLALLGWSPGDDRQIMNKDELIQAFTMDRVNSSNPIFDPQKLEWMNSQYIYSLGGDELRARVLPFLKRSGLFLEKMDGSEEQWLRDVLLLLRERSRKLTDFLALGHYFFSDEIYYDPAAVQKYFTEPEVSDRLASVRKRLTDVEPFSIEEIEKSIRGLAAEMGIKPAKLIHPIRVAVTGRKEGPGLFETLVLLGKTKVLDRLDKVICYLKQKTP